ncbi:MAG: zinc ribbon domain-containing protein [Zoogloeaceae bacterium]|nr:zinc ribbon domain-containing protein [Zoogloeaceae bacterium]
MPIYEYRCTACGARKEHIQKMSDAPLTTCPACGADGYAKQISAAGFQLKGSGWYATDFKNSGSAPSKPAEAAPAASACSTGGCGCH